MEIKVLHQIMDWNEDVSEEVRARLAERGICLINVMGSPGAGKTSLITSLIQKLKDRFRIGVIEGDIAGQVDADRTSPLGPPPGPIGPPGGEAESAQPAPRHPSCGRPLAERYPVTGLQLLD